jgi:uncharacterized membrane protein
MNWSLFYELNKEFINLHIIVGLIMLVTIPVVSYVVQIVHYIRDYITKLYETNYEND